MKALLAIFPAVFAWINLAWSYNHVTRREWAHALGQGIVGLVFACSALYLIAPAVGL